MKSSSQVFRFTSLELLNIIPFHAVLGALLLELVQTNVVWLVGPVPIPNSERGAWWTIQVGNEGCTSADDPYCHAIRFKERA